MAASPFAFFRGAAAVMAADLAAHARSPGLRVQACGDAHLSNFGVFARARPPPRLRPQRLRRVPAGALGVGRQAARRQLRDRRRAKTASGASSGARSRKPSARAYREAMRGFAGQSNLEVWYARLDVEAALGEVEGQSKRSEGGQAAAQERSPRPGPRTACGRSSKLTETVDGRAAVPQRTAAARPGRRSSSRRREGERADRGPARRHRPLPRHPAGRPPAPARRLRVPRHRPQGRRGRQRRHPRLGRPADRARRRRPAVPAGQGGRGLGARALRRAPAASATTAGGWSKASG